MIATATHQNTRLVRHFVWRGGYLQLDMVGAHTAASRAVEQTDVVEWMNSTRWQSARQHILLLQLAWWYLRAGTTYRYTCLMF